MSSYMYPPPPSQSSTLAKAEFTGGAGKAVARKNTRANTGYVRSLEAAQKNTNKMAAYNFKKMKKADREKFKAIAAAAEAAKARKR